MENLPISGGSRAGIEVMKSLPLGWTLIFAGSWDSYFIQKESFTHSTQVIGLIPNPIMLSSLIYAVFSVIISYFFEFGVKKMVVITVSHCNAYVTASFKSVFTGAVLNQYIVV